MGKLQRLFTLPILPASEVLSINGNAGDIGFVGLIESALIHLGNKPECYWERELYF